MKLLSEEPWDPMTHARICGRALLGTPEGGRFHALLVCTDDGRKWAVYYDRSQNELVAVDVTTLA